MRPPEFNPRGSPGHAAKTDAWPGVSPPKHADGDRAGVRWQGHHARPDGRLRHLSRRLMPRLPELIAGDCVGAMQAMALKGELFDAIVTDPPYDLVSVVKRFGGKNAAPARPGTDGAFVRQSKGFMGKQWDGTGIAFKPETWQAAFDVMKPGAHLVAFGGSRTFHRMAVAIEDAGFELRDTL